MTENSISAQASDEPMRAAHDKWLHDQLFNEPPLPVTTTGAFLAGVERVEALLATEKRKTLELQRVNDERGLQIERLETALSRAALKAQPAPTEAAQGEDSARLDGDMLALLIREAGILNERGMAWLLNGDSISLNLTNLLAIANMIEDRAAPQPQEKQS